MRILKVLFSRGGSGSLNTRLCLPISDLRDMGITEENRTLEYYYDEEKKEITIKKHNETV